MNAVCNILEQLFSVWGRQLTTRINSRQYNYSKEKCAGLMAFQKRNSAMVYRSRREQ
jgi:hypothetical protein